MGCLPILRCCYQTKQVHTLRNNTPKPAEWVFERKQGLNTVREPIYAAGLGAWSSEKAYVSSDRRIPQQIETPSGAKTRNTTSVNVFKNRAGDTSESAEQSRRHSTNPEKAAITKRNVVFHQPAVGEAL